MKKIKLFALTFLVASLALVACGAEEDPVIVQEAPSPTAVVQSETETETPAAEEPATLPPPVVVEDSGGESPNTDGEQQGALPEENDPGDKSLPSPGYGVHLVQWWDLQRIEQDMSQVSEMEFGWVKQHFPWRDIEPAEKGSYDWYRPDFIVEATERAGLELIVRIDRSPLWALLPYEADGVPVREGLPPYNLQDFADFCGVMAERYQGRVAAYQIWNEPNLSREWGERVPDAAGYVELLGVCSSAIRAADPGAIVISAALSPTGTQPPDAIPDDEYLRQMYAAGAAQHFDVLGVNAPGFKAPPEISPDEAIANPELYGNGRWFVFRHVEDMRQIMVENGDEDKQVAILEMGWTTDARPDSPYAWHAVSEAEQADYLVRAYQYAYENWRPWIGVMTTIYMADTAWTEEDEQFWWALNLPDGTHRPAYEALKQMEKQQQN